MKNFITLNNFDFDIYFLKSRELYKISEHFIQDRYYYGFIYSPSFFNSHIDLRRELNKHRRVFDNKYLYRKFSGDKKYQVFGPYSEIPIDCNYIVYIDKITFNNIKKHLDIPTVYNVVFNTFKNKETITENIRKIKRDLSLVLRNHSNDNIVRLKI